MKKRIQIICIIGLAIVLALPMLQHATGGLSNEPWYKAAKLKGMFETLDKPAVSQDAWFDQSYQQELEPYLKQETGFRNFMVRLRNQWVYEIYNEGRASNVVVGQDDYLYARNYIEATLGKDFLGDSLITENVKTLDSLRAWLKTQGKELLFVQAPGKATYNPEFMPKKDLARGFTRTNYESYKTAFEASSIPYFDVNDWFLKMKDTTQHVIYPKTGVHWSVYAEHLVFDSIARIAEVLFDTNLTRIAKLNLSKHKKARFTDSDVEDGINLLFDIKKPLYTYPNPEFNEGAKLKVNVIGDSFFWSVYGSGLAGKYFEPIGWWYYFNEFRNSERPGEVKKLEDMDVIHELKEADLLIILATDAQLSKMPWGLLEFIEDSQMLKQP